MVVGTADALAADFNERLDVVDRVFKDFQRLGVFVLLGDDVHRVVEDLLGDGLLTVVHQAVDELADELAVVARIRLEGFFACGPLLVSHVRNAPCGKC